jgi:uncharacterized protein (DUF885 family)
MSPTMPSLPRLAAVMILAVSFAPHAAAQAAAQRLKALGDEMIQREFDFLPAREAYSQGAGPRAGRTVEDLSPGFRERLRSMYRGVLEKLAAIPRAELSEADRVNYDLLKLRATNEMAEAEYPFAEIEILNPGFGLLPTLIHVGTGAQALRNEADFEAWLARLDATAATFEHAIGALRAAARQGWTTPRPLVEKSLRQLEAVSRVDAYQSPLWSVMAKYPQALSKERRAAYETRLAEVLDRKVHPAMARLAGFIRSEYLDQARETAGLGALPRGEAAYRARIRKFTTLDLAPEEIHALGLSEVARIRGRLLEVARKLGFTGEMRDFASWTAATPANYPFASRDEVLVYLKRVHQRVEPQLPKLFRRLPKAAFDIQATDPAVAASASATYSRPLADGSRPGVFRIPIVEPRRIAAFPLTSLLLHEGMPGHHLDIGRGIELDQPLFRRAQSLTVYSEGWGLYAESLGHELGVYDDPWALLGRYSAELHRAARLVVDTGIHWKGWSRDQAIRYLVEERGAAETSAIVAIERYMGTPGQALAYKIGEMEILRLRAEAERELGARFDLRDFHEVILGEGQVTLGMLRQRVQAWIASRRA